LQITNGVYQLTSGHGENIGLFSPDPNVFIVAGSEGVAFIDTGYGKALEIATYKDQLKTLGHPKVIAIILTHRHGDHIGGAKELYDYSGAQIISSSVEKAGIESSQYDITIEVGVNDSDTLDLGGVTLEFVFSPGHTMGSMSIFHREAGVLFTGDTILGKSTTAINPGQGDMGLYMKSLMKLKGYNSLLIGPGHGPPITDTNHWIDYLIDHRITRESQIMNLILEGNSTVISLFRAMYFDLDSRLHHSAKGQIICHLNKLIADDKVVKNNETYEVH